MKGDEVPNLGFMFANWYSGATLFAILLNNHKDITCNGEIFPFVEQEIDLYTCACGKSLLCCDFYRKSCGHMLNGTGDGWRQNSLLILPKISKNPFLDKWLKSYKYFPGLRDHFIEILTPYRRLVQEFVHGHLDFYRNACRYDRTRLYIDGSKSMRRAELLLAYSDTPLKVVYLVRDGRGFCFSYIKNNKLPKSKLPEAAEVWVEYNRNIKKFTKRYPNVPVLTVRYEDLCRDLERTLEDVADFYNLSHVDFSYNDHVYHMLGNKMRKNFDGKVLEDLRWQEALSPVEVDMITATMKEDLKYYGYV